MQKLFIFNLSAPTKEVQGKIINNGKQAVINNKKVATGGRSQRIFTSYFEGVQWKSERLTADIKSKKSAYEKAFQKWEAFAKKSNS